jgi:hypothetical protein
MTLFQGLLMTLCQTLCQTLYQTLYQILVKQATLRWMMRRWGRCCLAMLFARRSRATFFFFEKNIP